MVKFANKGMEKLGLERILKEEKIAELVPKSFKLSPQLSYKYTKPIRNKIFNYQEAITHIDDIDNMPCNCANMNGVCDMKEGHVVTGNLSIVKNKALRQILSYGPTYRPPVPIDWQVVFRRLKRS